MKTSGIYMIRHKKSGKAYIGRSVDIHTRWSGHKHDATFKRGNNPVHNAIRKYGADAFEWVVLVEAPAHEQPLLELQYIVSMNTVKPYGYNIGGTEGGFPSSELVQAMPLDQQAFWKEKMSRVGHIGVAALREKRKCPVYEKAYLERKSAGSSKREANIRARRAADPDYDARIHAAKSEASQRNPVHNPKKAAASLKERMAADPVFDAAFRENRARAGRISWEKRRARKGVAGGDLFGH